MFIIKWCLMFYIGKPGQRASQYWYIYNQCSEQYINDSVWYLFSELAELTQEVGSDLGDVALAEFGQRKKKGRWAYYIFFGSFVFVCHWALRPLLNMLVYGDSSLIVHSWVPFHSSRLPGFLANFMFQVTLIIRYQPSLYIISQKNTSYILFICFEGQFFISKLIIEYKKIILIYLLVFFL